MRGFAVAHRSGLTPEDRRAWLLAIGRRLRAEYAAVAEPVPERLAALVARFERTAEQSPAKLGNAPSSATPSHRPLVEVAAVPAHASVAPLAAALPVSPVDPR